MIKLVVGLGNPGLQYQRTRHNVGFLFLDDLVAANSGAQWQVNRQFFAEVSTFGYCGERVVAIKPNTFMNKSGQAVGVIAGFYKIKPEEILVVHDELELPVGRVKMKFGGGHAGHNGLRDIIARIGSADFYRLRIGIGRPQVGSVADYVLSRPSLEEQQEHGFLSGSMLAEVKLLLMADISVFNQRFS